MKEYVEKGGTQYNKWSQINLEVAHEFFRLRSEKLPVHYRDLREIALVAAEAFSMPQFKASEHWLHKFKANNRIVGRKITRVVGHRTIMEEAEIERSVHAFREQMAPVFASVSPALIFKADQVGINLEMTGGRTLEMQGAKIVEAMVQRVNATKHTFSLQLLIGADGTLHSPTLICFYEPKGAPGIFEAEVREFDNLQCVWSKSGRAPSRVAFTSGK
jgi:hypothetical protein